MIASIITDIDGVIVGDKLGYNSPFPNPLVSLRIKQIHASGIPVTLCTGKPHYAIRKIITDCNLNNPHITDGGAIIIDPITNTIVHKHVIDPSLVTQIVSAYIQAHMYVEIYTPECYIIQKDQIREPLTSLHTHILQTPPKIVDNLIIESRKHEVVKIVPIAINEENAIQMEQLFTPFSDRLMLARSIHPIALPHQFALITAKGVSKEQSAISVSSFLNISLEDCLGIGDSTSDWIFMKLCGYVATVENAKNELKKLVLSRGDARGFIGPSVDKNGMLSILDHFITGVV